MSNLPSSSDYKNFRNSINDSSFTTEQISFIWDFYVTKAFSSSTAQHRNVSDYDIKEIPFKEMLAVAEIPGELCVGLLANKMLKTLEKLKLDSEESIFSNDTPRAAFLIPFQISDDESPKPKSDGKPKIFLKHIRNALAHGRTSFLQNGFLFLEDQENTTITARIFIHQHTLLDWIKLIDKNQKFYKL